MTDTPIAELDRDILDLLQEEGGEVLIELAALVPVIGRLIKVASKLKRFGDTTNPFVADSEVKTNSRLLADEIGDFNALVKMLVKRGVLDAAYIQARESWKTDMLTTHGSIDWSKDKAPRTLKDATDEDLAGPNWGGYVNKAPYQEMRLRQVMTGTNAPTEADWVEALKTLNAFLRLTPEELAHRMEMGVALAGGGSVALDFSDYRPEYQETLLHRALAIQAMLFDRNVTL